MVNLTKIARCYSGQSGVYVLFKNKNVQYVGTSTNIYVRLLEHKADNKDFDGVLIIKNLYDNARKISEMAMICEFKPKLNTIIFDNFKHWFYSLPFEHGLSENYVTELSKEMKVLIDDFDGGIVSHEITTKEDLVYYILPKC